MSSNGSLVEKKGDAKAGSKNVLGAFRGPVAGGDVDVERIEDVSLVEPPVKQKKSRQLRRHFARFWCCYLFWNVIFLAIFLPIFFLIVIPAVAQLVVDKSDLVLVNAKLVEPRPDSMMLTLEAALDLGVIFPVRIEPLTLSIYDREATGNDTIFKSTIGASRIDGNTTLGVKDVLTPLNVPLWTEYVHKVVFNKNEPLPVKGSTTTYIGILKAHVHVDKLIHQNTLNSFEGFSIDDPQLIEKEEDGTNLIANATLPNPSVMTLQIGTTVLDLKAGDYTLGNATIDNLILYPGNHSASVRGILDLGYLVENLGGILKTQSDALNRGALSLTAVGRSVTYEGEDVPYYTKVMQELSLTADVSIAALLKNTIHGALHPDGEPGILDNLGNSNSNNTLDDALNGNDKG